MKSRPTWTCEAGNDEVQGHQPPIDVLFDVLFIGSIDTAHQAERQLLLEIAKAPLGLRGEFSIGYFLDTPQPDDLPAGIAMYNHGSVPHNAERHRVLKNSRIVVDTVQSDKRRTGAALLPYCHEVIGAGALFLAEQGHSASQYYQSGTEFDVFSNSKELLDKIYGYLAHPDKREHIAWQGQQRYRRDYSTQSRVQEIEAMIQKSTERYDKSMLVMVGGDHLFHGTNHRINLLVDFLKRRCRDVTIISPHPDVQPTQTLVDKLNAGRLGYGDLVFKNVQDSNATYYLIPHFHPGYKAMPIVMRHYVPLLLEKHHFDVSYSHGIELADVPKLLKEAGIVDMTVYLDVDYTPGFNYGDEFRKAAAALEEISIKSNDVVVSVSQELADWRKSRFPNKKIFSSPNGVRYDLFAKVQATPRQQPVMIYTGWLALSYGVHFPLLAMPQILKEVPDAQYIIIGFGNEDFKRILKELAIKLGVEKNVAFYDKQPYERLPEFLAKARVGIATFQDNELNQVLCPLKVFEYFAAGLPILGVKFGGLGRILREADAGIATETVDDIARGAITLFKNEILYQKYRNNAIQYAKNFDIEYLLEKEVNAVISCLEDSRSLQTGTLSGEVIPANISVASRTPVDVSIIIPTFNKLHFTQQCLESIAQSTRVGQYELIVVDNGSTDETSCFLQQEQAAGHLRAVFNNENLGFAKACNQGAQLAQGRYLLFLNNDTLPHSGWLDALVQMADSDPQIGILGSRLLYPDGTIQHAGVALTEQGLPYHIYRGVPHDHPDVLEVRDYPAVTGACLLIRRDLFQQLGGFDESYEMYVEDVELCLRTWEAGFRVVYCPTSVLTHYESASVTDVAQRDALVRAGWARLLRRWAGQWPAALRHLLPANSRRVDQRVCRDLPTLLWNAAVFDPSGLADEARHFAQALYRAGVRVRLNPMTRSVPDFVKGLDSQTREGLEGLCRTELGRDYINVVHFPAYAFRRDHQARYNIGRTLFETDRLPPEWVVRCNEMDEIWTATDFNRETFRRAGVKVPIYKVPEGIDTQRFHPDAPRLDLARMPAFKFLSIFEWIYRKGWDVLLRAYAEEFAPTEPVCLVLRTYPMGRSDDPKAGAEIDARIREFYAKQMGRDLESVAPIVVLHQTIPPHQLPSLYASVDAFVLPSRGEGWGRPYMEAMATGLPTIGTRWSGNLEFMHDGNSLLVEVEDFVEVGPEMEIPFYRGHYWAEPSVIHLRSLMRQVFEDRTGNRHLGSAARQDMVEKWSWDNAARLALERLEIIAGEQRSRGAREQRSRGAEEQGGQGDKETRGQGDKLHIGANLRDSGGSPSHAAPPVSPNFGGETPPRALTPPSVGGPGGPSPAPREGEVLKLAPMPLLPCTPAPVLRWEGSQFVHHSLALINRELCLQLIDAGYELSIIPYEPDQFGPEADPRFHKLAGRVRASLSRPADVHVRHQWPPNFTPPPEGRWVMIQPWEFGSLPKHWVEVMSTQVDEVWVPSSYTRECYIRSGVPADRVHVVPNGVDPRLFHPGVPPLDLAMFERPALSAAKGSTFNVQRSTFNFLFVGGTIYRKGIDLLLEAYMRTFSRADNVCLVIKDMGGRSFYQGQTFEQEIRRLQALPDAPPILYLDRDLAPGQLPGLYTACHCLVHPYRGEGFGLPIAEAMACGLPVIVTNHGAALDFCDQETAYLIPAVENRLPERRIGNMETVDYPWMAEPDLEALARLMRYVYEHPQAAHALGARASARIRTGLTWERAAEKAITRLKALREQPVRRHQPQMHGSVGAKDIGANDSTLLPSSTAPLRLLEQANTAISRNNLPEARTILEQALADYPDSPEIRAALASVAMAQGHFWEAQDQLISAIELAPDDPELHNQLGSAYFSAGDHGMAEQAFRQALTLDPVNLNARMSLAELARAQGQYDAAARHYIQALKEHPDDVELLVAFGRLALEIDEPDTARAAFRRALARDPSCEDARRALEMLERPPTTDRRPPESLSAAGGPPSAVELLAQANDAIARGDLSTAGQVLRACVDHYPTCVDGYVGLASVASTQGNYFQAQDLLLTAIELDSARPELFNQLGCAYFADRQAELAERAFRQALDLDPTNPEALLNLAELYRSAGRYAEAAESLKRALQHHRDKRDVLTAFGNFCLEIDEPEAAELAFQRLMKADG